MAYVGGGDYPRQAVLAASMVGAAAMQVPRVEGALRGSATAQAASFIADAAQDVVAEAAVDGVVAVGAF